MQDALEHYKAGNTLKAEQSLHLYCVDTDEAPPEDIAAAKLFLAFIEKTNDITFKRRFLNFVAGVPGLLAAINT